MREEWRGARTRMESSNLLVAGAFERAAEILLVLGDDGAAERRLVEARRVYERVNDLFWMEDEQLYAVGLDEHVDHLVAAMIDASRHFARLRLPEALAGHARTPGEPPGVYPQANAPQAWSASATVQFVQIQLGIQPFAAARALALVRPRLPAWLPDVTLHHVRVGDAIVSLRFRRRDDGSAEHEASNRTGTLRVIEAPSPADVEAGSEGLHERLVRFAAEHAPGTTARAIRIALGAER
ncbi:MAG TPA: hypothetical protein VFL93_06265 [Longimicrobiaceae bacterium]|nr:hypothetical protein [Longimicrobiaceae bacterium]